MTFNPYQIGSAIPASYPVYSNPLSLTAAYARNSSFSPGINKSARSFYGTGSTLYDGRLPFVESRANFYNLNINYDMLNPYVRLPTQQAVLARQAIANPVRDNLQRFDRTVYPQGMASVYPSVAYRGYVPPYVIPSTAAAYGAGPISYGIGRPYISPYESAYGMPYATPYNAPYQIAQPNPIACRLAVQQNGGTTYDADSFCGPAI